MSGEKKTKSYSLVSEIAPVAVQIIDSGFNVDTTGLPFRRKVVNNSRIRIKSQ
jgi:hypothetical protein